MVLLPTFCPDCNRFTMKVVKYGVDDSYEARCTTCGYHSFGKISPELLIASASGSALQKTSLNESPDFRHVRPRGRKKGFSRA